MVQKAIHSGDMIIKICNDFKKAFDTVEFRFLLNELHKCGIRGPLGRWIMNWCQDNKFSVKFGEVSSEWKPILSGLKQGSSFGPLAFLIAINTLINSLPMGSSVMFADDQTILIQVHKKSEKDIKFANDLLRICHEWSQRVRLYYNVSKCKYIIIPNKNLSVELVMGDECLEEVSSLETLGILFSGRNANIFEDQHERIRGSCGLITNKLLINFKKSPF